MGLRPLPPTPESGVVCNKCNDGVQLVQIILHQVHKFAFGKETEAKNQLWVIRKAFRTAEAENWNSEWTLAIRKSLLRAPNGPPGESKKRPWTPPEGFPKLVKARGAASEPLAAAPCQKSPRKSLPLTSAQAAPQLARCRNLSLCTQIRITRITTTRLTSQEFEP